MIAVVGDTYTAWREDRTIRLGAGLAYYGLFAIVPLMAITAALAEVLFGEVDMVAFFTDQLANLGIEPSQEASAALTDEINSLSTQTSLGLVGLVSLLFASSLLFVALNDAISEIWREPVETGLADTIRRRLLGFAMVLMTGGVLIAAFAVSTVAGAAEALMPGDIAVLDQLADLLTGAAAAALLTAGIALLLRFVSPVTVPWKIAALTGIATAVLLYASTIAVGWFLDRFGGASVTGAFSAVLAVLSWIYFEAQILLAGVQLSKVLTVQARDDVAFPERVPPIVDNSTPDRGVRASET